MRGILDLSSQRISIPFLSYFCSVVFPRRHPECEIHCEHNLPCACGPFPCPCWVRVGGKGIQCAPKKLRQDASWTGISVTEEVTALSPELYLGHEVNSVFLAGSGQQWSRTGKQGRRQLERDIGARQLFSGVTVTSGCWDHSKSLLCMASSGASEEARGTS